MIWKCDRFLHKQAEREAETNPFEAFSCLEFYFKPLRSCHWVELSQLSCINPHFDMSQNSRPSASLHIIRNSIEFNKAIFIIIYLDICILVTFSYYGPVARPNPFLARLYIVDSCLSMRPPPYNIFVHINFAVCKWSIQPELISGLNWSHSEWNESYSIRCIAKHSNILISVRQNRTVVSIWFYDKFTASETVYIFSERDFLINLNAFHRLYFLIWDSKCSKFDRIMRVFTFPK